MIRFHSNRIGLPDDWCKHLSYLLFDQLDLYE
jgi:hypothetical protein